MIGIVGFIGFFLMIGIVGNYERAEEVVAHMSQEAYEAVVAKLGENASEIKIADEYMANKSYYDNLY